MPYNTPPEIAAAAAASGTAKANLAPGRALVGGFLAGAYIAFGALLAIVVTAGLDAKTWGGLITLFTGLVFSLGLILVVDRRRGTAHRQHGADADGGVRQADHRRQDADQLAVGDDRQPARLAVRRVLPGRQDRRARQDGHRPGFTRLGAIAMGKAVTETHWEQFLRAVGCNWLVCLAVWLALAATDVGGKILAIVFPITAFVALGFDHVVANMFFLPAAMFLDAGGVSGGDMILNLIFAFLGNAVGAGLFVAGAYWYLYGTAAEPATAPAPPAAPRRTR